MTYFFAFNTARHLMKKKKKKWKCLWKSKAIKISLKHPDIYVKYDFIYVIKIPADSKKNEGKTISRWYDLHST